MSERSERLEPVLALADDLPFFPANYYENRRPAFLGRALLLILLAVIVYLPTFTAPFLWTDQDQVANNLLLRTTQGLAHIWAHPSSTGQYRPLSATLLWLEFRIFRQFPGGYHAVSIALHAAAGLLVWLILRRLAVPGAWLAAAVFLLHPLQVHAVAWIFPQSTLLSTAFTLAAILAFLRFARVHPNPPSHYAAWFIRQPDASLAPDPDSGLPPERRILWYALALSAFTASLLSHIAASTIPLLLLLILRWQHRRFIKSTWLALLPFFILAAISLAGAAWLHHLYHADADPTPVSISARLLIAPRTVLTLAAKLLFPYPLSFVYPRWDVANPTLLSFLFPAALLLLIVIIAYAARRNSSSSLPRSILFAPALYAIALLPFSGLTENEWTPQSPLADYFQYFPGVALIALTIAACLAAIRHLTASRTSQPRSAPPSNDLPRAAKLAFATILLTVLSVLTWRQSTLYADERTLWQNALTHYPQLALAHLRLGELSLAKGDLPAAISEFQQAIQQNPADVRPVLQLGEAFEQQNQFDSAILQYQKASQLQPTNGRHLARLAEVYARQNKIPDALAAYQKALSLRPSDDQVLNNLGLLYANNNQLPEAIEQYQKALQANPASLAAHLNLSNALFRTGDLDGAAEQLQLAIKIDPANFEAYMNSGAMLGQLKQFEKAERMFRAAVNVRASSPQAYNYLGVTLAAQGKLAEALFCFDKALQLNPEFPEAKQNLQKAEQQLKDTATTRPTK